MNPEHAKAAADMLIDVWEGEVRSTCQVLGAVARGNRDYKPDAKSRTAWEIATHIATADVWFIDSIIDGKFVWNPEGAQQAEAQFKNAADLEAFYNKTFPEKLRALRGLPAEKLVEPLSFFGMFEWPRVRFIGFANNHSVHHRGQLAAYLRAMGSKVPDIYGPSADSEKTATT
jgi:uncharacterized damage-inducible protein DinB